MPKTKTTQSLLYQKLFDQFKGQTTTGALKKIHSVGFFQSRLAYLQTQTDQGFEDFYNGLDHDCLAIAMSDADDIIIFKEPQDVQAIVS